MRARCRWPEKLGQVEGIDRVEGPFSITNPATGAPMTDAELAQLYAADPATLPPDLAAGLAALRETYIRDGTIRLDAISPLNSAEPAGTAVVSKVRAVVLDPAMERMQVGGGAALGEDFLLSQAGSIPWAVGTTLLASAIILFLLFGSLAIPIKAVLMTLLSLTASFGALVWIFQEGNLHELLAFEPLGYTIAGNPIIMFAVLIGLSMDYEVLLLSRIQESYRRTGDNAAAVADGLAKTAGVITGAALIMVIVFAAFALAETVTIKSIGVGMALAVLLDATIIRVLLVPATMRLLGGWNWWAPGPLGRLAERFGFSHVEDEEDLAAASGAAGRIQRAGGRAGCAGRTADRGEADMDTSDREPDPLKDTIPPESGPVRAYGWEWGREEDRRPQLPWIGVFLVVFGGLLLVDRLCAPVLRRQQPDRARGRAWRS